MISLNGALDRGPQPLELPIGIPVDLPHAGRRSRAVERPARTRIEIDLVVTDNDATHDDDARDRGTVIEIDLA